MSREEKKTMLEINKILDSSNAIPIDGHCVRVPVLRCHSMGITIKLKKNIPLDEIVQIIDNAHPYVRVIPNNKADTLKHLTPAAVSNTLDIHVGRIRKLTLGEEYLGLFVVGDQLLWGAAEPIRRVLQIIIEYEREKDLTP